MSPAIRAAVLNVLELLVQGRYERVELLTGARRLSAFELERAIREYGRTPVMPPAGSEFIDAVQVRGHVPPAWSVRVDLWTKEEGRSDLTLELTAVDDPNGPDIAVDDLHVL